MISTDHDIPITKTCALAVSLDMGKRTEEILIGELDDIKRHLGGISDGDDLYRIRRDIGRLLMDYEPTAGEIADIRAVLVDSLGKNKSIYFDRTVFALAAYYQSDNPILRFTAILMWQEYHRALQDKNVSERLLDTLDGITTALRFNVMDMVKGWQEMNRKNPLVFLDHDFRKYPVSLYFGCDKETSEYAVTDKSALSIAVYYLKRVYESGRYIQACPICGRSFVAKTAGMTTLCSDECRRIQGKENKRRFDERAKRTSYERSSKNAYMYWYNKIARLRDMPEIPNHLLKKAESLFKAYTEESAKQKKAVAKKQTNPEVFEAWLLSQRDVIDKIMEKILSSVKR